MLSAVDSILILVRPEILLKMLCIIIKMHDRGLALLVGVMF